MKKLLSLVLTLTLAFSLAACTNSGTTENSDSVSSPASEGIAPFVTSGGSGFSGSIGTIERMEPEAAVTEGLSLGSSQAAEPAATVTEWLAANGLSD